MRGEVEAFDEDALLTSLGLLWRFGGNGRSDSDDGLFTTNTSTDSDSGLTGASAAVLPTLDDDDDNDGVPNSIDDCTDTAPGEPVTATGCAMFGGVLEGVNFASGSDQLLDEAQVVLNDAADVLLNDPSLTVEVQAHTDSQGLSLIHI